MSARTRIPVPRLALRTEEAAASLGVGLDHFRANIAPELRAVQQNRVRLYPVAELERWLEREATMALQARPR